MDERHLCLIVGDNEIDWTTHQHSQTSSLHLERESSRKVPCFMLFFFFQRHQFEFEEHPPTMKSLLDQVLSSRLGMSIMWYESMKNALPFKTTTIYIYCNSCPLFFSLTHILKSILVGWFNYVLMSCSSHLEVY